MGDKKRAKEIIRSINKNKKRVAGKFDKKIEKNQRLFSILIPVFAGLLFFIFAILNLNSSVWFEESYAKYATQGNFSDIFSVTTADARSPLYYIILKMWSSIFGTTAVSLRFMSIFFGLIAIVFLFHLVKRWFGIKTAMFSTLLVSISPMLIRFGQEIGVFTILLASLVISTYTLSLAIEKKTDKKGTKFWVMYAIFSAFSLWLNYLSVFVIASQIVSVVLHFGGVKKILKNKKLFKRIAISVGATILLFVPWIVIMAIRSSNVVRESELVSFGKIADLISSTLFYNGAFGSTGWIVIIGILFIIAMSIASAMVYKKASIKNKEKLRITLLFTILPLAFLTIFSVPPLNGVFETKNILFSIVSIWVFFGIVISMMKEMWLKNVLMAFVLMISGIGIFNVENRTTEGHMSEVLAETFIGAEESEPIVIKGVKNFYDGVFYTNDKHKIYLFEDEMESNDGSTEAIKYYKTNLVSQKDEFLKEYESVWYIIDTPAVGVKYEIPKWAEKMRITSEISLDHHTALEFTK